MEMSLLTVWAVVTGSALAACGFAFLAFPERMKSGILSFPRNVLAGRILAALDIALVAWLLLTEGFVWFDAHRQLVFIAAPAAFFVVIFFMDELLSVRALGGLFLLIPFWILKAAFLHPATSRLLMTIFAYLLVAAGMVLTWSPYLFRRFVNRAYAGAHIDYAIGLSGASLGLAMIIMGLIVY